MTQGQAFADRAGGHLGFAQLTLAFAELASDDTDHRIGLAWRELAYAQSEVALFDDARDSLQIALQILEATPAGLPHIFLVLEDLASNARLRGALEEADRLYDRADEEYSARGLKESAPLGDYDMGILKLNRARLALELGNLSKAKELLDGAEMLVDAHLASDLAKPNDMREKANLLETRAILLAAMDAPEKAIEAVQDSAETARSAYPAGHPDGLRALLNAADQALVLGNQALGFRLLTDVWDAAQTALPEGHPLRTETQLKLAVRDLQDDQLASATDHLRRVTEARKSAAYRSELPTSASDFEMLAWALLSASSVSENDLSDALDALQWTQVSRSADALAMMQSRLAAEDQGTARLLRARQNIADQLIRSRSDLTAAYTQGSDPGPVLDRQSVLNAELIRADAALQESGVSLIGAGPVSSLGLSDIQALLAPDEVLVTFLLPGLKPTMIPGLDGSSNKAIAIWRDGYQIGSVREVSRGALRKRITEFRCQMALSDVSCAAAALAGLRGTMEEEDEDDAGDHSQHLAFEPALAHRLYLDLFGGIEAALEGRARLILVPPSDLLRLPFSALVTDATDPAAPNWLIRDHAISIVPSIPALASLRARSEVASGPMSFLGIGDPDFGAGPDRACDSVQLASLRAALDASGALYQTNWQDGLRLADPAVLRGMSRLADATCELKAIEAVAGKDNSTLITRNAASESFVKRLSTVGTLAEQDIIVFATHSVLAGEGSAVSPGLVLSPPQSATPEDDGLLTSAEVALLDLNADLVILSACNTASGESGADEGLSGLASSFFHAGARNLMVTHWAVYSPASAEVSASVAGQFATGTTRDAAMALRKAVLTMLDDPARPALVRHPSYWAPFAIVGG